METPSKSIYDAWHLISEETLREWTSEENISLRNKRTFQGFEIVDSLDGRVDENVEVSLVRITEQGQYPQHVHNGSDAYFIILNGHAILLSGKDRREISQGDRIDIPRGKPHGFELTNGESFEFISIQSPPIKDLHSGEEDFHLVDQV